VDLKQQIAQLEQQIATLKSGGGARPQGLLSEGGASSAPPLKEIYGLLAQYGDPMAAAQGYVGASQRQQQLDLGGIGAPQTPASIREWEYFNSLPEEDQQRYLQMKRGLQFQTLAGEQFMQTPGGLEQVTTLGEEAGAAGTVAGAKAFGGSMATRYQMLNDTAPQRNENFRTAQELLTKVQEQELRTGPIVGALGKVLPSADQAKLDSLSLFITRERLRAAGESRPTDADVKQMRDALFGVRSPNDFTKDQLAMIIREMQAVDGEYRNLQRMVQPFGMSYAPNAGLLDEGGAPVAGATGQQINRGVQANYDNMSLDEMLKAVPGG
jgi:hypothetical protein